MIPDVRSLSEQAYEWLKEKIFSGELAPGKRVSIDTLAAEIGVSRTPIRDAINRLSLEGLVVVKPRRGTIVGSLSIRDVEEIYEARRLLEPAAFEAAARGASERLIADLERIHREWAQIDPAEVYNDFALHNRYAELDTQFHLRVVAELGNSYLNQIAAQLNLQRRVAPRLYRSRFRGPQQRMAEHQRILNAIVERDGPSAREAVAAHLANAQRDLVAFLRKQQLEGGADADGREQSPERAALAAS